jgi:predicted O-methyltransferase YrrM
MNFDIDALEWITKHFEPISTGHEFLDGRYDWQKNENGAEWPYYRFFYHLSQWLQPKIVLELGTYQGTAAAHFAAGCDQTIVITIDHHTDPGDEMNQLKVLAAQDEFSNLIYYQGWSTPELSEKNKGQHLRGDAQSAHQMVSDTLEHYQQKIDILFIDSWHCYEYATMDYEAYRPLLSSPALIICDDIQAGGGPESPIQGMMKFWEEMPEPKFLNSNLHPGTNMGFVKYDFIKVG